MDFAQGFGLFNFVPNQFVWSEKYEFEYNAN